MDRLPTQFPGCQPPHPGFFIGEVLADLGTNLTMFAEKICEPENVARDILRGKRQVYGKLAERVGHAVGVPPGLLLRLQLEHDKWLPDQAT